MSSKSKPINYYSNIMQRHIQTIRNLVSNFSLFFIDIFSTFLKLIVLKDTSTIYILFLIKKLKSFFCFQYMMMLILRYGYICHLETNNLITVRLTTIDNTEITRMFLVGKFINNDGFILNTGFS